MSLITGRGRALRDAAIVTLFVMLAVSLALQIKTNNSQASRDALVARRQHDSCTSRRVIARESGRRQYVLTRFLETAADTRLKLSRHDANHVARSINLHIAWYWKNTLLPMIHTIPIPPAC